MMWWRPKVNAWGWHVYGGVVLLGIGFGCWDWRIGLAAVGLCLIGLGFLGGARDAYRH